MKKYSRILVIPDIHAPFHHKDAFKFLDAVNERFKPDKIVQLGDEVDGHSISFHDKDPDIPFSPSSELDEAIWYLKDLYALFPKMDILDSNHGSLVYRRAKFSGLPRSVIRPWNEILEAPKGYVWHDELVLTMSDGRKVMFHHGLSKNSLMNSRNKSMCFVQGHHHGTMDTQYWSNGVDVFWGVTAGCLIDYTELAFAYGKNTLPKPLLGCTMILNGYPIIIPMVLDKKRKWIGKLIL